MALLPLNSMLPEFKFLLPTQSLIKHSFKALQLEPESKIMLLKRHYIHYVYLRDTKYIDFISPSPL